MTEKTATATKDEAAITEQQPVGPVDPTDEQRSTIEGLRDDLDGIKDDIEDLVEGGGTGFVARDATSALASVNDAIRRFDNLLSSHEDQKRALEGQKPERERQVINARAAGIPAPGEEVDPDTGDIVDAKGKKVSDTPTARERQVAGPKGRVTPPVADGS